jgi:modulator of FtsH protease
MAIEAWANFFVAQCGASAALLGLLFVSVSLNLARILALAHLPERALLAMFLLLTILIVASAMLMPGQSLRADGIEVLAAGAAICGAGAAAKIRDFDRLNSDWRQYYLFDLSFLAVATLPYLVAGGLLFLGAAAGFYWLAAAILLSTAKAVTDAWVLLVEINR